MTTASNLSTHPQSPHAGLVLYVGLPDAQGDAPVTDLGELAEIAETLRELARDLLPSAETFTALSFAPHPREPDQVQALRERLTELPPAAARRQTYQPDVRIDLGRSEVSVHGDLVRLTRRELAVLSHLVRAPHRVVTTTELLRSVWGVPPSAVGVRAVKVHVRRLREKVTGPAVATVPGVGYRFDPTPHIVLSGSGDAG